VPSSDTLPGERTLLSAADLAEPAYAGLREAEQSANASAVVPIRKIWDFFKGFLHTAQNITSNLLLDQLKRI